MLIIKAHCKQSGLLAVARSSQRTGIGKIAEVLTPTDRSPSRSRARQEGDPRPPLGSPTKRFSPYVIGYFDVHSASAAPRRTLLIHRFATAARRRTPEARPARGALRRIGLRAKRSINRRITADTLEDAAALAAAQMQSEIAVQLAGAAAGVRSQVGAAVPDST